MSRMTKFLPALTWIAVTVTVLVSVSCSPQDGGTDRPTGQSADSIRQPAEPGDETDVPAARLDATGAAKDPVLPVEDLPALLGEPFDPLAEWEPDGRLDDPSRAPSREPDVHFVPTHQEVVEKMLELAEVTKDDVVYDLGCGDGRIVVTAAKKYGCTAIGVDIDPKRIQESMKNVRDNRLGHLVTIKKGDIFELDLRPASVVTLYLLPHLNVKLIPQLEKLKPGSRIVSHAFDMHGVKPARVYNMTTSDGETYDIYLWKTPLQKE